MANVHAVYHEDTHGNGWWLWTSAAVCMPVSLTPPPSPPPLPFSSPLPPPFSSLPTPPSSNDPTAFPCISSWVGSSVLLPCFCLVFHQSTRPAVIFPRAAGISESDFQSSCGAALCQIWILFSLQTHLTAVSCCHQTLRRHRGVAAIRPPRSGGA